MQNPRMLDIDNIKNDISLMLYYTAKFHCVWYS